MTNMYIYLFSIVMIVVLGNNLRIYNHALDIVINGFH